MGSAINKQKISSKYSNYKIKKYNEKYNDNFEWKKGKEDRKVYPFNSRAITVKYLIKPPNASPPKYSYTYKGVPGGYFF